MCIYAVCARRAKRGQKTRARKRERGDEGRNTNSIQERERKKDGGRMKASKEEGEKELFNDVTHLFDGQ